ncbi:MAG: SPOR domain-containing protein [Burkholderiales bacterium]
MRIVIVLLLLANVTMYLYTRLDTGGGEGMLLQDQVQPDKIKLLTPQQVAALGPAKVAALNDVCVEWGPFAEADRARAMAEMEPLALGRLVSQKKVEIESGFWVNMGPFATKAAAENRIAELRRQGVKELSVADAAKGQFAVSFGNFASEAAALAHTEELARIGIKLAKVERRNQPFSQTVVVVRDPQQSVMTRLRELMPQFPGSDLRTAPCERAT